MGKRFAILIGVAAAGMMALGTQTTAAPSDVVKYDTKLKISADRGFQYHGWVKSEVRKCERGRWVTLFKRRAGADRRLGTDRSFIYGADQFAQWLIIGPRWEGRRLYAKVMPKVGDGFRCRADRSRIYRDRARPDAAGVMALGTQTTAAGPADVVEYETKLTLGLHVHQRFYYWLRAEGTECEFGRRVVLFLRRPGADRKLGSDRFGYDNVGPRWRDAVIIARPHRVTVVYAKVRREVHDEFVCDRDRSQLHDDRPR